MRKSSMIATIFGLVALLGALATIALDDSNVAPRPNAIPGSLATAPLTSVDGPTSLSAFKGQWTILVFGYMTCPDVCPTALAYLAREIEALGPQARGARVAFISVDPRRDGPLALAKYVRHFRPDFVGLTGEDPALKTITAAIGAYYGYQDAPDSAADYLVTHTSSFFLLDPQTRFVKALPAPHERGVVTQELARLIGNGAH